MQTESVRRKKNNNEECFETYLEGPSDVTSSGAVKEEKESLI